MLGYAAQGLHTDQGAANSGQLIVDEILKGSRRLGEGG